MRVDIFDKIIDIRKFSIGNDLISPMVSKKREVDVRNVWKVIFKKNIPLENDSDIIFYFHALRLALVDSNFSHAENVLKRKIANGSLLCKLCLGIIYDKVPEHEDKADEIFLQIFDETIETDNTDPDISLINKFAVSNYVQSKKEKNIDKIIAIYQRRCEKFKCFETEYLLASLYYDIEEYQKSHDCCKKISEEFSNYEPELMILFAKTKVALGNTTDAKKIYLEIIKNTTHDNVASARVIEGLFYLVDSFVDQYKLLEKYKHILPDIYLKNHDLTADIHFQTLEPLFNLYTQFQIKHSKIDECDICLNKTRLIQRPQCCHFCCESCFIKNENIFNRCHMCMLELVEFNNDENDSQSDTSSNEYNTHNTHNRNDIVNIINSSIDKLNTFIHIL